VSELKVVVELSNPVVNTSGASGFKSLSLYANALSVSAFSSPALDSSRAAAFCVVASAQSVGDSH